MKFLLVLTLIILNFANTAKASPVHEDVKIMHDAIYKMDILVNYYRTDIHPLLERLVKNPRAIYNQEEIKEIQSFWTQFVDYKIVLNSLYNSYDGVDGELANLVKYTVNLHLNTRAAELSSKLWNNKNARKKLDEKNEEQIPRGSFISMENSLFRQFNPSLSLVDLPTFFPVYSLEADRRKFSGYYSLNSDIYAEIDVLNRDAEKSISTYVSFLTDNSNVKEVKERFFIYKFKNLFFKIMKKISTWLGSTKVNNRDPSEYNGQTYIDLRMAYEMESKVLPGDIMLSKTEWFLSNIFLPGFWPHSFLYIGNLQKLKLYFTDREVTEYFYSQCVNESLYCVDFTSYLEMSENTKSQWSEYRKHDQHGFENSLIEATKDGVHFSSIRHTFFNDHLAALRPRLSKKEKAIAIVEAMSKVGLPYDYDFDFQTDDRLVCSELVAKSYMKDSRRVGINFNFDLDKEKYLELIMGRINLPVINIVHKVYDEEVLSLRKSELDFVAFLKGNAKTKTAIFTTKDDFISTKDWKKWSFMNN